MWQEQGAGDPGDPQGHLEQHQEEYGVGFTVVVLDVFELDGENADGDDQEDDVDEGEEVVASMVITIGNKTQPLKGYHNLKLASSHLNKRCK